MAVDKAKNEVVIDVRFSYVQVWEPKVAKGSTRPKYSVSALWDKKDVEINKAVTAAFNAGVVLGKEKKWKSKTSTVLISKVVHDGDKERPNNPEYKGKYYVSAKADNPPGVGKFLNGKLVAVIDKSEFYSGCYGKINFSFYPFNEPGDGIAVGLNHVAKTKEGEKLGGGPGSLESAFGEVEMEDGLGLGGESLGLGDDDDIM